MRWSCQTILDYWLTKLYNMDRDDVDTTLADFDPESAPELPTSCARTWGWTRSTRTIPTFSSAGEEFTPRRAC